MTPGCGAPGATNALQHTSEARRTLNFKPPDACTANARSVEGLPRCSRAVSAVPRARPPYGNRTHLRTWQRLTEPAFGDARGRGIGRGTSSRTDAATGR